MNIQELYTYTTAPDARYIGEMGNETTHHSATQDIRGSVDAFTFLDGLGELFATHLQGSSGYQEALWIVQETAVLVYVHPGSNVNIHVLGKEDGENVREVLRMVANLVEPLPVLSDTETRVRFWYQTSQGPKNSTRTIVIPEWKDITQNYAAKARTELDDLMNLTPERITSGRLLLMHGPAGTGKTTAIRALMNTWKPWCESEYVIDPEAAFGDASYLLSLLLDDQAEGMENDPHTKKWRLLVMEDAEEFLKPSAKKEVGQSVARLLNFGDGLLGQGLNVLVLMTTNVEINELHPAITRPGRCLSNISVPKLSAEEATAWMGSPHEEASLAELFEAKTASQIGHGADGIDISKVGTYL